MLKASARKTTGRHGYWKREVSRRKVKMVRVVETKHKMAQTLIHPTENDFDAEVK